MGTTYDTMIIGGGPAGLTAAIYASRARVSHVLVEKAPYFGGQITTTDWVENYPGILNGLSGFELTEIFAQQAQKFGANFEQGEIVSFHRDSDIFVAQLEDHAITARSAILCSGAKPKQTHAEGEDKFIGRGISFCATCDGALYRGKTVAVIGGGESALQEALFLTRFAEKVFVIHRRDKLRASAISQERAHANSKIEFILSHVPQRFIGYGTIKAMELKSTVSGEVFELPVHGVFEYVGLLPNTSFVNIPELRRDELGFVLTDAEMCTNVSGFFAAGDVRAKAFRQVSTAVGDGATAQFAAERYVEQL